MNGEGHEIVGTIPRKKRPPFPSASAIESSMPHDMMPVPTRKPRQLPTSSSSPTFRPGRQKVSTIQQISEFPLVLKIRTKDVPMIEGLPQYTRVSLRQPKRKRPIYEEPNETDSDDLLGTDEEDLLPPKKPKQVVDPAAADAAGVVGVLAEQQKWGVDPSEPVIDAPPPGTLSTLWYSDEAMLHIFVLEKVVGWKTRTEFRLVDAVAGQDIELEAAQATAFQITALTSDEFWNHPRKRMEVSRVVPTKCPVILAMAFEQREQEIAVQQDAALPRWRLQPVGKEEVILVKWRGRSHLHCSWERASDVQRLDVNNTARNKIKRFYQFQEMKYGADWKQVIESERATAAMIHAGVVSSPDSLDEQQADQDDDFFSPQCLEVERILACDENSMNMKILAKQRALNMRAEQEAVRRRDEEAVHADHTLFESGDTDEKALKGICSLVDGLVDTSKEAAWDPEDNVRYVVKWKGLPYAEITWEFWRDIKREAVDEAEDFWHRQELPDMEKVIKMTQKAHPHIREFRKLHESPVFGVLSRERPVDGLVDGKESATANDEDEGDVSRGFKLRSYQLEGVNWLLFNWWNKRSPILADEMGLGKTIQTVAFLRELQTQSATQVRGPFLIVAPLSLIGQWQSELHSWSPDMNVVLYHGSADARDFLVKQEFYYTDQFVPKPIAMKLKKHHVTKFDVLITTYEVVLKDIAVLSKIRWRALIVDEAHRLKNHRSKLYEELATVPRDYCLLLTGTPIANATEELWALLHFANPTVFHDKNGFLDKFGEMTDAKQVEELHSLLKPYLLRRVKDDVEKSLPPKEETILEVSLTPIQKTYYKAIYERNTAFLYKGAKPSNAPSLMNIMMELRKCCNHPYLIKGAEERILADAAAKLKDRKDEHGSEIPFDHTKLFEEQLVKSSGKMVLLEKLLQKLFQDGHKVLIFSQMVRALDLLEELIKLKRYRYERLDGSTSSSSRSHAVDRFNKKSMQRFVMLLSTRAGGLGLNLTAADRVIIFDSDFNPQNDLQAMARAHRIGQTRAVQVFRLLTAKSYEMHMFHTASLKLGLERAVLSQNREQGDESDDNKVAKTKSEREAQAKEIDELLKKGAYDIFRDEDDKEAEKFMETDIDQLLAFSSKKVTYGAAATASLGGGLGSFSKASFVANTEDGEKDVDLDDPDFWSKAVGLEVQEETPDDIAAMLDDGVKRSRKQVQVYDPYAETAEAEKLKKERLALEKLLEREEKERLKLEKKLKKKDAKDKKKRDKGDQKGSNVEKSVNGLDKSPTEGDKERLLKDPKPKKSKKSDRQRALRRAENEHPVLERLKQAWEVPQRAKATAAIIRFGCGRFCKIRNESNLTSLPLQDLECFARSYIYQLALQVAATLLTRLNENRAASDLRHLFKEWLGMWSPLELDWICDAVQSVMKLQLEVEGLRRELRMPIILAEPAFIDVLRQGAAFRALRRTGILSRLNRFVEDCVDSILSALGHEELGKRGCPANDLPDLDVDLKARFVTTEELSLAISSKLLVINVRPPATWWDRRCDVALVVGTFVHGLGNYEAIRNDFDLPFAERLRKASHEDEGCDAACHLFRIVSSAARKVFDDALEAVRVKAELEVQAAVAAAAKAASKREEDAALLRKGGAEAEVVASSMPETQVENAFEFDGTDSHFVTLPRIQSYISDAVRKDFFAPSIVNSNPAAHALPDAVRSDENGDEPIDDMPSGRLRDHERLPMPDARVLDHRLMLILRNIEMGLYGEEFDDLDEDNPDLWRKTDDVLTNIQVRRQGLSGFVCDVEDRINEYFGVGLGAYQCGTSHRTLNDGSDFGFGSASSQLSQVAYGTDAPRYLRAIGVPMNVTRFAISGLLYAENSWVQELLEMENLRFYGTKVPPSKLREVLSPESPEEKLKLKNDKPVSSSAKDGSTSAVADKVKPVDPVELIPDVFRENAQLRAYVCLAVLFYGFPCHGESAADVRPDLWSWCKQQSGAHPSLASPPLFDDASFRDVVAALAPDVDVPDAKSIRHYVEKILLPHCLRLCVNGNGPTTRGARGSQGEYETALGVSLHPEPSEMYPSPLPDPCFTVQEHSLEALGQANAILRRVRLFRTCQFICHDSSISLDLLTTVADSRALRAVQGLPVWWSPSLHDLALVVQAATGGLFSVLRDRSKHEVFTVQAVQRSLFSSVVANDEGNSSIGRTLPEKVTLWTERQAERFPSLNQLERRLAFFCSRATADVQSEARFDCIPMFDHGAWPRD